MHHHLPNYGRGMEGVGPLKPAGRNRCPSNSMVGRNYRNFSSTSTASSQASGRYTVKTKGCRSVHFIEIQLNRKPGGFLRHVCRRSTYTTQYTCMSHVITNQKNVLFSETLATGQDRVWLRKHWWRNPTYRETCQTQPPMCS
jgi:hypothetical protein